MLDALAPTNFPWSNPEVLRATVDEGGANFVKGARQFIRDVSRPPRLPASVDSSAFEVGVNVAATPGAVVLRTEVFELIHYKPQTKRVRTVPLLFVPPTINRYYILDIAPGRSMIEYLVRKGQQVFVMSWRNPEAAQGHFDLDTYAQAILEARDAVAEISKQAAVHVNAACSGGIIGAAAVGHLQATGELSKVASLTLLVCAIDTTRASDAAALVTREVAATAVAESARKGYLDGQALAGVFAWLRPNDLVWNYVVNNYLLGKDPPTFDILFWNQDTARLARAGLHRDFILLALENSMAHPGEAVTLGTPIDLGAVDLDTYAVAGLKDHIVGWEAAYRSARLLGGGQALRALHERPHPGAGQPPHTGLAIELPAHRRVPAGGAGLRRTGGRQARQLVAGLQRMAREPIWRPAPRAQGPRKQEAPRHRPRAGHERPRGVTGWPRRPPS